MLRTMIPCRAAEGEEIPNPNTHWAVVFVDFFKCGFQLPPLTFFKQVLAFFAHLYEAYLAIRPSLDLFRYYYHMKRTQRNNVVGGASLRLRDGGKERYLNFSSKSSWSGWHSKWFYYQPPALGGISYCGLMPYPTDAWSEMPRLTIKLKTHALKISDLKERGLTAWDVAKDFIMRRISCQDPGIMIDLGNDKSLKPEQLPNISYDYHM